MYSKHINTNKIPRNLLTKLPISMLKGPCFNTLKNKKYPTYNMIRMSTKNALFMKTVTEMGKFKSKLRSLLLFKAYYSTNEVLYDLE